MVDCIENMLRFRSLALIVLILNVEYLLSNFQVARVKDVVSLIAIPLLFRCADIYHNPWQLYGYIATLSSYNLWDIAIVYRIFSNSPNSEFIIRFIQVVHALAFLIVLRIRKIPCMLVIGLMILKILQAHNLDSIRYFKEAETVFVLGMSLFIDRPGFSPVYKPRLRDGGILELMQHNMCITSSFMYFALYFIVSAIWNLIFKNVIFDSLVQVFGMACLVWLMAVTVMRNYQFDMSGMIRKNYLTKIQKLNFLAWFLAVLFYDRSWKLLNIVEQFLPICKSFFVIVVYFLASLLTAVRHVEASRKSGNYLAKSRGRCLLNNSHLIYTTILVFPVLVQLSCWYFDVYSVHVIVIMILSCKLAFSVLNEWLPAYNEEFKLFCSCSINALSIIFLCMYIRLIVKYYGLVGCFEVVNLMWMNQMYVSVRRIWEKCMGSRAPGQEVLGALTDYDAIVRARRFPQGPNPWFFVEDRLGMQFSRDFLERN